MAESGIGGSKGESSTEEQQQMSSRVQVPDFLRPFLDTVLGSARGGLQALSGMAGTNMIPGYNYLQEMGERSAIDFAEGRDGFLPAAEEFFRGAAAGTPLQDFMHTGALQRLEQSLGGVPLGDALPGGAAQELQEIAGGRDLYGGAGYEATLKAARDAALPMVGSAFGGTRGGLSGALAQQAVGDTIGRAGVEYLDKAKQRQLQAMGLLEGTTARGRGEALDSANRLTGLSNLERGRAFSAASALPGLGRIKSDIYSGIGENRRALEERMARNPFETLSQLLALTQGMFPLQALLGEDREGTASSTSKEKGFNIGLGWD